MAVYKRAFQPPPSFPSSSTNTRHVPLMRHVSKGTIPCVSARAGIWAVACMAQRRRPVDWALISPFSSHWPTSESIFKP